MCRKVSGACIVQTKAECTLALQGCHCLWAEVRNPKSSSFIPDGGKGQVLKEENYPGVESLKKKTSNNRKVGPVGTGCLCTRL